MPTYKVVFSGLTEGVATDDAINSLMVKFKLTQPQAASLVQGGAQIVRKALDLKTAAKYEAGFAAAGCVVAVLPEVDEEEPLVLDIAPEQKISVTATAPSLGSAKSTAARVPLQFLGILLASVFLYYALSVFGPSGLKTAVDSVAGPNELEKALVVGKSRGEDFAQFNAKGGLDLENRWKGFRVAELNVQHGDSGVLSTIFLKVYRKAAGYSLASIENLKTALQTECGTQWLVNSDQGGMKSTGMSGVKCLVNGYGGPAAPMEVMIAREETAAAAPAPPSKTLAERTTQAIQNMLACTSNPEPGNALGALRNTGYIGEKPKRVIDGMNVYAVLKFVSVFGYRVLYITGWEDDGDPTLFGRGPGTAPPLNFTAYVEGDPAIVKAEVKRRMGDGPAVEDGSFVDDTKTISEISCYGK